MTTINAINSADPIQVALGGTGVASTTAYAVVCGGSTSTAALQHISSVGTSGQFLVSNGAGALPSFQTIDTSTGVQRVVVQTFTMSGTYTPTSGLLYCTIEVVGGGGGGSGRSGFGSTSGGGGGGYARKTVSAATIGASKSVTIGAGGIGSSSGSGGDGGTTSIGSTIVSASGGGGGQTGAQVYLGGIGGIGSSGDFNIQGWDGGSVDNLFSGLGGSGGGSYFGGGTSQTDSNLGPTGYSYGSGGGGGISNPSSVTGGNGAPGICVITEYCT